MGPIPGDQTITRIASVEPIHVAAWVQDSGRVRSRPQAASSAVRMLFDWNDPRSVPPRQPGRLGPWAEHNVKRGKTPVLSSEEMVSS